MPTTPSGLPTRHFVLGSRPFDLRAVEESRETLRNAEGVTSMRQMLVLHKPPSIPFRL